jgi:hypothetical protein
MTTGMLRLVSNMLHAGYLEDWVWNPTLSGVPQGGVASPILSNIYLHRFDTFVEKVLLPEYNRGVRRTHNPAYCKVQGRLAKARRRSDTAAVRSLRRKLRSRSCQVEQGWRLAEWSWTAEGEPSGLAQQGVMDELRPERRLARYRVVRSGSGGRQRP